MWYLCLFDFFPDKKTKLNLCSRRFLVTKMGFKAKSSRLQSWSSVIMPEKRVQSEIVLRTPARSWAQSKVHAHWWPRQSVTQYSPELFSYLYKLPLKDYPPFFSTLVLFCRRRKTWKKLCWAESQGRDIFDDTESGSLGIFFSLGGLSLPMNLLAHEHTMYIIVNS